MSIKPVLREGFSPNYYGIGTHLHVAVHRSTGTPRLALAKRIIKGWERDIENHRFAAPDEPTFVSAAVAYMKANGERRPIAKLIAHFGDTPLSAIDQHALDAAAAVLFPDHSAATRNREVYTPASSILKHAGRDFRIKRPSGSRGRELSGWLWPEEAERIFDAGRALDREFGALLVFLCYTGCRLGEALKLRCDDVRLADGEAFVRTTKNGEPRRVFLPPVVVAELGNHPRGLERPGERVFRYAKSGRLYALLDRAAAAAQIALPDREAFHIFRHTYGSWMRRYAGADSKSLVATGTWKSEQSASRYAHAVVSEEAKRAALLPTKAKVAR
jgi:integrase